MKIRPSKEGLFYSTQELPTNLLREILPVAAKVIIILQTVYLYLIFIILLNIQQIQSVRDFKFSS